MSDLKPLTETELADMECWADHDLGAHAEEADRDRLRSMVFEIRMHRDAMAPAMLRAARLYTDELGALRKRVAELEAVAAARDQLAIELAQAGRIARHEVAVLLGEPSLDAPPPRVPSDIEARYMTFARLRAELTEADVCLACGDHTPGRTCQCENDE